MAEAPDEVDPTVIPHPLDPTVIIQPLEGGSSVPMNAYVVEGAVVTDEEVAEFQSVKNRKKIIKARETSKKRSLSLGSGEGDAKKRQTYGLGEGDPGSFKAYAQEDEVEDDTIYEEDDDEVEVDDGDGNDVETTGEEEEEVEEETKAGGSPDADTVILFTKPATTGEELPGGKLVEFLVGFTNNGDKDFILDSIDASFRYPMDFNFYIQNFTMIQYNRAVKPRQEATVMYSFYPAESFAGRPLGLTVNLAYHDADGNPFTEAVFNQTVTITDIDEGLDGETFFLYLFLLAFAILLLLAGHHFLSSFSRKKSSKKPVVEMGTGSNGDVDYDWIPKETLNELKKTPRQSPRQRKAKRDESS